MKDDIFDTGFELKFLSTTGLFEGYASVFNVTDSMNDMIAPGAFKESLAEFTKEGRLPPLLWQHNVDEPIGAWREMREDSHGLYVKGELFISDIPLAKEAYKLLKENVVSGLSIGFRTKESHRDQKTGTRVLTKLDLLEVSLVTFPANTDARVTSVKTFFSAGKTPTMREFEAFLRSAGLSRKQAKGVVSHGYKAIAAKEEDSTLLAIQRLRASIRQATYEIITKSRKSTAKEDTAPNPYDTDGDGDDIGEDSKTPKPTDEMSISKEGVQEISKYENFEPQVYLDLNGHPTIGYGHKLLPGESFPEGITKEQGLDLLLQDLNTAENAVRNQVTTDLTQPQFDALTSLVFNIGSGNFSQSDVLYHVNEGDFNAAANAFSHFTRAGGDPSALSGRRGAEAALFRSGIPK